MKKVFAFSLILLLFPAFWFANGRKSPALYWSKMTAPREEIPEKYVTTAECRDVDYSIEVSGDVAPEFQLDVKSEVGGKGRK